MKYKVTLNNRVYEVEVEKGEAMLVDEYEAKAPVAPAPAVQSVVPAAPAPAPVAAASTAGLTGEPVKAPMPGNVLKITVTEGQEVQEGDVVIVLEAMKMENEITAVRTGTVSKILVSKGQLVETGAVLLTIA